MTMLEWLKGLKVLKHKLAVARRGVHPGQSLVGREAAYATLRAAEDAYQQHVDKKPREPVGTNWSTPGRANP